MFKLIPYILLGENMNKLLAKLFNVDKKVLIFIIIICFIGLLTGSLFMTVLSYNDKLLIKDTLSSFISNIETNNINNLRDNIIVNLVSILSIWILGISIIGIPIVIMFIFFKSFIFSFSIASFIANFKFKGLILSLIYNFPHNFIILLIFIYLSVYSIKSSIIILCSVLGRKNLNFKVLMNKYLLILVITVVITIMMNLFEYFVTPRLLKIMTNML